LQLCLRHRLGRHGLIQHHTIASIRGYALDHAFFVNREILHVSVCTRKTYDAL
jgi:hypothetical protein